MAETRAENDGQGEMLESSSQRQVFGEGADGFQRRTSAMLCCVLLRLGPLCFVNPSNTTSNSLA